jgi:hypothetical protein
VHPAEIRGGLPSRQLAVTNIPYELTRETGRYEFKGTYSATASHRFQGAYTKISDKQVNCCTQFQLLDERSLEDREQPQDLFTVNYSGILTSKVFVEGRYSHRQFTFVGSGAKSTDRIDGTLMVDNARALRYWSPTFCGVGRPACPPEQRDNENFFIKGTYFLSTAGAGSHNVVMGYDNPVLLGSNDTTRIQYNPIPLESLGSNFRTHALFVNDSWRISGRLTANLGVRWDKNHGKDQQGNLTAKDQAISPRFGMVWDPLGDQRWSITGSFAKYVTAISNRIADMASAAGNSQMYIWYYRGPDINANANAPLTSTPLAAASASRRSAHRATTAMSFTRHGWRVCP